MFYVCEREREKNSEKEKLLQYWDGFEKSSAEHIVSKIKSFPMVIKKTFKYKFRSSEPNFNLYKVQTNVIFLT